MRNGCDDNDVEANPGPVRTPLSMSGVAADCGYSDCFPQNFQQRSYAQFNAEEAWCANIKIAFLLLLVYCSDFTSLHVVLNKFRFLCESLQRDISFYFC